MTQAIKTRPSKTSHPCIWMQAGVARKKSCNNYYNCTDCKYDSAMVKLADSGKQMSWQDALRMRDSRERTCRHTLTNRTTHKVCPMNYNCSRCDFDQYFEDVLTPMTGPGAVHVNTVKGFDVAAGYFFHNGHTWAEIEDGGVIRVGMDDFSMKVFGTPDGFELPLTGQELNRDTIGFGIKRKDRPADVLSPINGVITQVNPDIRKSARMASQAPYGAGWLFTVHNSDIKSTFKSLMTGDDSLKWIDGEVDVLESMIEKETGPLSTDGGLLMADVFGNLPALGWENLTRAFLKT